MQIIFAFKTSFLMFWEIFWPLVLGFLLSAIIQTVVSHRKVASLLGKDSIKCFSLSAFFGIASSSCSYAAVAIARSIFKKGATFTSSMIFELASTNLVIELGLILIVLMGWQFALAEYLGGIIMVVLIALIFRFTLTKTLVSKAIGQSQKGMLNKMEGHAQMDMSLSEGSLFSKIFSENGFTAISHYFVMDIASVWFDIFLGLLIAGIIAVFIPSYFWKEFFLTNSPKLSFIEGPLIGPLISIFSFVCSVGNIPLAAVLWKEGISFGGVVSFIFADLIVLPILDIYRKYYGLKMMGYILITFYIAMALAGYAIEILFSFLNLIPTSRSGVLISKGIDINYTFFLNLVFLTLAGIFVLRFLKTNGMDMLKMMK